VISVHYCSFNYILAEQLPNCLFAYLGGCTARVIHLNKELNSESRLLVFKLQEFKKEAIHKDVVLTTDKGW
jgi:hypothetical protein